MFAARRNARKKLKINNVELPGKKCVIEYWKFVWPVFGYVFRREGLGLYRAGKRLVGAARLVWEGQWPKGGV